MKKISLNFFGEKAEINMPTNLESLKKAISDQFLFSPSDAAELIIGYAKDLGKKIIETEQDFQNFVKEKIFQIDLDINENSRIYKENLNEIEKDQNLKELDLLVNNRKKLIEENEKELKESKEKITQLQKQIMEINKKIFSSRNELRKKYADNLKKIEEEDIKINNLRQKLNLSPEPKRVQKPLFPQRKCVQNIHGFPKCIPHHRPRTGNANMTAQTFDKNPMWIFLEKKIEEFKNKFVEKKEEKEEKKLENNNQPIHRNVKCDGCGAYPIVGNRYKCCVCNNFDYCEACEEKFRDEHQHPFIKIYKPEQRVNLNKFRFNQNFPIFNNNNKH